MGKRELWIKNRYVTLPIWAGQPTEKLEVFCGAEKLFELRVPKGPAQPGEPESFCAPLPVGDYIGREIVITGDFSDEFFAGIRNAEEAETSGRPAVHFTAQSGWINDPNGLVYQDGVYHLYFQYNPFDTRWENMCWGHAESVDLLHWEQLETALYPDATGTMFSGSGIVNERGLLDLPKDALIFFYTAAAASNEWTAAKGFTQRIAYSLDGGRTLVKTDRGALPTVEGENRDPKVFWHEESQAYIMVLWLYEDVFGVYRSADLESWEESDRVKLDKGWECPDLFCLADDDGNSQWVFTEAGGGYYLGAFDGYRFTQTAERKCMYMNKAAYAAQTYSNVSDRRILVAWLRLCLNSEHNAGAMGLPRELSLTGTGAAARLRLRPVREFYEQCENLSDLVFQSVSCADGTSEYHWNISEVAISYNKESGELAVGDEKLLIPAGIADFTFLLDGSILEITADHDTLFGAFEIPS